MQNPIKDRRAPNAAPDADVASAPVLAHGCVFEGPTQRYQHMKHPKTYQEYIAMCERENDSAMKSNYEETPHPVMKREKLKDD